MPAPPPPIAASSPDSGGKAPAPSRRAPDPPGTSFHRVLDQHDKAWTADAGGQQSGTASDTPSDAKQQQPGDAATLLAALVAGPVPVAAPATPAASGSGAPATAVGAAPAPAPAAGAIPVAVVASPAAGAATPAGAPVAPVATDAPAVEATAPAPAPAPAGSADDAVPVATAGTPAAADAPSAGSGQAGGQAAGQGSGGARPQDVPQDAAPHARRAVEGAREALAGLAGRSPAAAVPAPAAPAGPAAAPAPAPAPSGPAATAAATDDAVPAPAAPAPAASAPAAGPTPPPAPPTVAASTPVPAAQAPAALAELVQVAQSRGVTQARLVLHPDSLGGVAVHLRQTADGIHATVHVEHPDALQVLQNGLGDLRRGLEARGITIDALDVGLAPGNQDAQQGGDRSARGDRGLGTRSGPVAIGALDGADADDPSLTPTATTSPTAAGVLVDVMA